jgi:TPP-dependent pyruvate/acetoin dehydrogenase alpha subunit
LNKKGGVEFVYPQKQEEALYQKCVGCKVQGFRVDGLGFIRV